MLTPEQLKRIEDRVKSIPPETRIAWLKMRAAKGDKRAMKALNKLKQEELAAKAAEQSASDKAQVQPDIPYRRDDAPYGRGPADSPYRGHADVAAELGQNIVDADCVYADNKEKPVECTQSGGSVSLDRNAASVPFNRSEDLKGDCMDENRKASASSEVQVGFHFVPNAEDWKRLTRMGLYHIEAMARQAGATAVNFADWSKRMLETIGEGVRPHLNEIWRRSQNEYRRQLALQRSGKAQSETSQKATTKAWVGRWFRARNVLSWIVVVIIGVLCFFPPWIYKLNYNGIFKVEPAGPAFIWDGPGTDYERIGTILMEKGCHIDLYRLAAELIPCLAVLYVLQRKTS